MTIDRHSFIDSTTAIPLGTSLRGDTAEPKNKNKSVNFALVGVGKWVYQMVKLVLTRERLSGFVCWLAVAGMLNDGQACQPTPINPSPLAQQPTEVPAAQSPGWLVDIPPAQGQQPEVSAPLVLTPSGLPGNATPEAILPAGAILHLRINGAGTLLDDASQMLTPFIPEKAVGPAAELALEEPNPLLALIGLQTMGEPMSVDQLSAMSGIDPARPITLSLYLAEPPQGFAICIPVLDLERPSALITNAIPEAGPIEKIELDGGFAQFIKTPDLDFFIVCSQDTICLCGSEEIAQAAINSPAESKLEQSGFIMDAINRNPHDNVLLAIDAQPVKPLLPMLERFHFPPQDAIDQMRAEMMSEFDDEALDAINLRLSSQFGVRDIDQLLDYVECIGIGGYEIIFETLYQTMDDFHGMTISTDLAEEFQTLRVIVFSGAISGKSWTRPLPLADAKNVLSSMPGSHDFLVLTGQAPQPEKSQLLDAIVKRIGEKMQQKQLPMDLHDNVRAAIDAHIPIAPLESKVKWKVGTRFFADHKRPEEYEGLQSFVNDWTANFALINMEAIPPQQEGFLESHFEQKSKATNSNYANWRKLVRTVNSNDPFFIQYSNSSSEKLDNGVHKLIYEDCFRMPFGWFGYNEHELINRYFTLYRNLDDHILIWPGGTDPDQLINLKPHPIAKATERLLANADIQEDVHRIEVLRTVQGILGVVDFVASTETLIHNELSAYLQRLQKIVEAHGEDEDFEQMVVEMSKLEMPITVAHVQWDEAEDRLYLVTPAGLTFPRPKLMPLAVEVLDDYRQASDSIGGVVLHHSTRDGQFEFVVTQSTAGISKLIRSVGNNIAQQYLHNPTGQQHLQEMLHTRLDASSGVDERLLTNTFWSFLD